MFSRFRPLPSAERIEAMALATMERLPPQFREHLGDVVLQVEDFADAQTLASVGLSNPHQLSGIYEGIPLDRKSISHSGAMPDRIRLFRIPILQEWRARGDVSLEFLVAHVLIHEVGHHFGLSDETIDWLEEQAE